MEELEVELEAERSRLCALATVWMDLRRMELVCE